MFEIILSSPCGSGQTFAIELLQSSFGHIPCTAGGHERKDILGNDLRVVILRNPYDAIASGAERYMDTSNHKGLLEEEKLNISDIDGIRFQISRGEEKRYFEFFKDIENLKNIKILSFELLTKDPKKFIDEVGKFFKHAPLPNEKEKNNIFKKLAESGYANRIPREKNDSRIVIDNLVLEMYPKETWRCWEIYSNLKAKLDLEGL